MDKFYPVAPQSAAEGLRFTMRDDNRHEDAGYSERDIQVAGDALKVYLRRHGVVLVSKDEFKKARAYKDALKDFLHEDPDTYLEMEN